MLVHGHLIAHFHVWDAVLVHNGAHTPDGLPYIHRRFSKAELALNQVLHYLLSSHLHPL
jgi:hypothetical protein